MLTVSASGLTKIVASRRLKGVVSAVGCAVGDKHYLPTSKPSDAKLSKEGVKQSPQVWRDRVSATIHLAATPEARSLSSL